MKKVLLSALALLFMSSAVGRDTKVDWVSSRVVRELRALPAKSVSFSKKLLDFEKAVNYLKGARNCLSGIGCSKRQSYLANYLLGATYGFAQSAAFVAIEQSNPARWQGNPLEGKLGLSHILVWVDLLVKELGYRYLVKEKVYLFRCLTFRGCTDQTKRYAFYNLGIWSGRIGVGLSLLPLKIKKKRLQEEKQWRKYKEKVRQKEEERREYEKKWRQKWGLERKQLGLIEIDDNNVKDILGLDKNKDKFFWYEVLGVQEETSQENAKKAFRTLTIKYHPDKSGGDPTTEILYNKIQQALNAVKEKRNF